jgi:leucyl aminopeptidase (aminopeptidase T)
LLTECDAAVFYTSTLSALAESVQELTKHGTRLLFVPADLDMRRPFVLAEDLRALGELGSRVCARLRESRVLRLTSPEGTDLTLRTGGAIGYDDCRATGAGETDFFPGGMWNLVPEIESVNGVVKFCAALHPVGRLADPIELQFSDGKVTSVHGGWQARAWQRWLEGFGESDVTRFAHLSGGLAARAQVIGHDWEDLVVRGSVLIGGGASLLYGGANSAAAHFDGIIPEATLSADGTVLIDSGTYAGEMLSHVTRHDEEVSV